MSEQRCDQLEPTTGRRCVKRAGHLLAPFDSGQHFTYTQDGREMVWLAVVVPPKEIP